MPWDPGVLRKYNSTGHFRLLNQLRTELRDNPLIRPGEGESVATANRSRSLIRAMLNSARGLSDKDVSPQAQAARRINGFADLDGLEFVARIDIGTDTRMMIGSRKLSNSAASARKITISAKPKVTRKPELSWTYWRVWPP